MRSFPIEYYVLTGIKEDGPTVGYLAGEPIAEWITDLRGRRYRYAGLLPRRSRGQVDVKNLGFDEWIVQPGLVYVHDDAAIDNA
jgi:hypothetical protein